LQQEPLPEVLEDRPSQREPLPERPEEEPWRQVRGNELAFTKRWGYLSQRLAWQMQQENEDGYVLLDENEANALVTWVTGQPAVDDPVDIVHLQESLDDMMSGN
jgi:hypothetical protein